MSNVVSAIQQKDTMRALRYNEFAEEGKFADQVAKQYGGDLNPTQLRKIFQHLKSIQQRVRKRDPEEDFAEEADLLRLMPQIAYAAGRDNIPKGFYNLLRVCFSSEKIQTNEDFLHAFDFIEAILAYQKLRS
jgi:CRISPR-associated protein Csm2